MQVPVTAVAVAFLASSTFAFATEGATKDDAVAMVKSAIAAIKSEGPEKAYAEINTPGGPFEKGELYALVEGFDVTVLAHAANQKLVGKNLNDVQDVDGKYFAKDLAAIGRTKTSFWYDYKFVNPATKKIQVKDTYCESLNETVVCAGVYRP